MTLQTNDCICDTVHAKCRAELAAVKAERDELLDLVTRALLHNLVRVPTWIEDARAALEKARKG